MHISLLGTGLLGRPMSERLLQAGYPLTVYNRTLAKANPLKEKGATVAETAEQAVKEGDGIILLLTDAKAIEEVLFVGGEESLKDKTVIQMGTIGPAESIELQKKIFNYGGEYLEAPVLGSRNEAEQGTLILMAGSTEEKFKKWEKVLKVFGPNPRLIGEVGKAAAMKLALNQLIAAHAASFSLSLGLIEKNGIDLNHFSDILKESSLIAPMYEKKLSNWQKRQFSNPNFPVKHLLKDVELILAEAQDKNLSIEMIEALRYLFTKTVTKGLGEEDYSAVFNTINNIE